MASDYLVTGAKGYQALGAFDRDERSQALDQLGLQVDAGRLPGEVERRIGEEPVREDRLREGRRGLRERHRDVALERGPTPEAKVVVGVAEFVGVGVHPRERRLEVEQDTAVAVR